MEMLCETNNVRRYLVMAASVVLALILFAVPATAMFSNSNGSQNEETYLQQSADDLKNLTVDGKDVNSAIGNQFEHGESEQATADNAKLTETQNNIPNVTNQQSQKDNNNDKNDANAPKVEDNDDDKKSSDGKTQEELKIVNAFNLDKTSDIPYHDEYSYVFVVFEKKNDISLLKRKNVASGQIKRVFELNGNYETFSGTEIIFYEMRETSRKSQFKVYADGKLVYTGKGLTGGSDSQDFSIDVSGVDELTVEYVGSSSKIYNKYEFAGLSNCIFKK